MKPLRLAIVLLLAPIIAFGGSEKLSKDLKKADKNEIVEVIVQFDKSLDRANLSKIRAKFANKAEKDGGLKKADLDVVGGGVFQVKAKHLDKLSAEPGVKYISQNRSILPAMDYTIPTVGADLAQAYGWDGDGIGVAVIDSGVETRNPDIGYKVVYQQDFTGQPNERDGYGHGTHVAGIIAGSGGASNGHFIGVAPEAHVVSLRALNTTGAGTDSGVIAAIERAIELKATYNIRVMNLSLGRAVYESFELDPLCQAVQAAWDAGIVVVVAAGNEGRENSFGNEGYGTVGSPGNSPFVITVGAMKTNETPTRGDDLIASYSSKGPTLIDHIVKPDLVAPGNRVISLV